MLFGEHDHIVPAALMQQLEREKYPAKLAMMQGVSHVPMVSAPELFATALLDFWRAEKLL